MCPSFQLDKRKHWIFDMDGTLTVSAHDFEFIRAELGIPSGEPILEALHRLPRRQAAPLWEKLNRLEERFAREASLMHGAIELLEKLDARGAELAILTRNTMPVVEKTLETCGLERFFPLCHRLDRDACVPKPSPDGILRLLELWQAEASDTVMVGDFLYDLQAGRSAGVATIHLDVDGDRDWPEYTDIKVRHFSELAALL